MSEGDFMRLNLSCEKKIPADDNTATCFIGKFNDSECLFVDVTRLKKVYTRIRRLIVAYDHFFLKLRKAVIH